MTTSRTVGWHPDPGSHEYRYFDGTGWTDQVADAGLVSVDAPGLAQINADAMAAFPPPSTPPALPPPPNLAGWRADPLGRHQQRYFDGKQWTDRVADHSRESRDVTNLGPLNAGTYSGGTPLPQGPAPWYKKGWVIGVGAVVLLLIVIAAVNGGKKNDTSTPSDAPDATASSDSSVVGQDNPGESGESAQQDTPAEDESAAAEPPKKEEPEMTSGQENALGSAQSYIELSGFSKKGLIEQLSSSAGEGYSKADATFAANHVGADWKQEAVEAAKNYLDISPMSKDSLIEQLSSSAGDEFTPAQARYAANKVY